MGDDLCAADIRKQPAGQMNNISQQHNFQSSSTSLASGNRRLNKRSKNRRQDHKYQHQHHFNSRHPGYNPVAAAAAAAAKAKGKAGGGQGAVGLGVEEVSCSSSCSSSHYSTSDEEVSNSPFSIHSLSQVSRFLKFK